MLRYPTAENVYKNNNDDVDEEAEGIQVKNSLMKRR